MNVEQYHWLRIINNDSIVEIRTSNGGDYHVTIIHSTEFGDQVRDRGKFDRPEMVIRWLDNRREMEDSQQIALLRAIKGMHLNVEGVGFMIHA